MSRFEEIVDKFNLIGALSGEDIQWLIDRVRQDDVEDNNAP